MSEMPMDAAGIEARASAWVIDSKACDHWSSNDQAELDAWLNQSLAHRIAYWRMNQAWSYTNRLAALRGSQSDAEEKSSGTSGSMPLLLKIAAAFVVVATLSAAATSFLSHPRDRLYSTPVGAREVVSFADGSRIELNTNTVLRARMTTDQRIVWLDRGEAFFQIKHDPAHPFIVMVGNHRVTDLGTQFSVRRETGKLQVAVMQGRVTLDAPDAQGAAQIALLTPGDVATAVANKISVKRASQKVLTLSLGWRHGALIFDNTSLSDAAVEFNRYNRQQLVIADPSVANLKIYGTFRADNVGDFTRLTEAVFGLRVADQGNRIVLSR
jgi:transmembrane sensor